MTARTVCERRSESKDSPVVGASRHPPGRSHTFGRPCFGEGRCRQLVETHPSHDMSSYASRGVHLAARSPRLHPSTHLAAPRHAADVDCAPRQPLTDSSCQGAGQEGERPLGRPDDQGGLRTLLPERVLRGPAVQTRARRQHDRTLAERPAGTRELRRVPARGVQAVARVRWRPGSGAFLAWA